MEAKQTCFDVERDRKSLNSSSESSCNLLDVLSRVPGLLLRFLWLVNCGVFADIFKKKRNFVGSLDPLQKPEWLCSFSTFIRFIECGRSCTNQRFCSTTSHCVLPINEWCFLLRQTYFPGLLTLLFRESLSQHQHSFMSTLLFSHV